MDKYLVMETTLGFIHLLFLAGSCKPKPPLDPLVRQAQLEQQELLEPLVQRAIQDQ
jgi:hypothetical protein